MDQNGQNKKSLDVHFEMKNRRKYRNRCDLRSEIQNGQNGAS